VPAARLLLLPAYPLRLTLACADGPFWRASNLLAPRRATVLATLRAILDPETLAAALERGHARDPWITTATLLNKLATGA